MFDVHNTLQPATTSQWVKSYLLLDRKRSKQDLHAYS